MGEERADCRNSSNPYHECSEYCFKIIADAKKLGIENQAADACFQPTSDEKVELTGKQKKLLELKLKMNEARKANQAAMVAENKRMEPPQGISKHKWLDANINGLKACMLDTQQMAETKYKKQSAAPAGWDVFNQKTLYDAYKKRTKKMDVNFVEYNKMKESDPKLYKVSEDKIEKMVKELKDRDEKRNTFSRRRRFHQEKDIDSINDRNEHFNKKIHRAFGTLEIKNNLERGTALPD